MPPTRRLVVEADGGSRGNPGVAGYGAVVRDAATGRVLVERAGPLGQRSNNVAEYRGLIAGLEAAAALAPGADVEVRMDSKLVIEQMAGRWKVKHEDMRALSSEARQLLAGLGAVTWRWVPRERNTAADRLSNLGMDGRTVDTLSAALAPATQPRAPQAPEAPAPQAPAPQARAPQARAPQAQWERGARVSERSAPRDSEQQLLATRLLLVRHAVTDFTAQNRLDGRGGPDPDLNDAGRRQATSTALAVRALVEDGDARLVTSSLARARQTGAAIAERLGVEPVADEGWDEQSFGDWDGAAFDELAATEADDLRRLWVDRDYRRPGGESLAELETRVLDAYQRAVRDPGTIVVVAHRKPILVVLASVLGISGERFWALATDPASLTGVELWPDGRVSVPFVNRTAHLA